MIAPTEPLTGFKGGGDWNWGGGGGLKMKRLHKVMKMM